MFVCLCADLRARLVRGGGKNNREATCGTARPFLRLRRLHDGRKRLPASQEHLLAAHEAQRARSGQLHDHHEGKNTMKIILSDPFSFIYKFFFHFSGHSLR